MNWPQWRGANRDGISMETGFSTNWPAEGPATVWKKNLGKGLSSFALSGNRLYTLGNSNNTDTVFCFEAETGREIWTHSYSCSSTNHAMSIVPNGPAATPTFDEGRLYTVSREGDFFCLDASSGKVLWSKNLVKDLQGKRPVYGYANSPLVDHNFLYLDVGGANGSTMALDKITGEILWRNGSMEAGYSSATISTYENGKVLFMFKGEAMCAFDAETGKELWQHPCENRDFVNACTPVVSGKKVWISSTNKDGTQLLDWTEGGVKVTWHNPGLGTLFNNAILWKGNLYGFNDSNRTATEFVCLDAASGKINWTYTGLEKGTFILVQEHFLFLTSRGELAIGEISSQGLQLRSRSQLLGGRCWAVPVLHQGKVFCRNNDGDMLCLNLSSDNKSLSAK